MRMPGHSLRLASANVDFERGASASEFGKSWRSPNWHGRRQCLMLDSRGRCSVESGSPLFHQKSNIQNLKSPFPQHPPRLPLAPPDGALELALVAINPNMLCKEVASACSWSSHCHLIETGNNSVIDKFVTHQYGALRATDQCADQTEAAIIGANDLAAAAQ